MLHQHATTASLRARGVAPGAESFEEVMDKGLPFLCAQAAQYRLI
jgi:hypothetical protein